MEIRKSKRQQEKQEKQNAQDILIRTCVNKLNIEQSEKNELINDGYSVINGVSQMTTGDQKNNFKDGKNHKVGSFGRFILMSNRDTSGDLTYGAQHSTNSLNDLNEDFIKGHMINSFLCGQDDVSNLVPIPENINKIHIPYEDVLKKIAELNRLINPDDNSYTFLIYEVSRQDYGDWQFTFNLNVSIYSVNSSKATLINKSKYDKYINLSGFNSEQKDRLGDMSTGIILSE